MSRSGSRMTKPFLSVSTQPFLLPAAHDADRGLDRRADEVGDVLPGERNRDEDSVGAFLAGALGEGREEPGGAVLDGAGHVGQAAVERHQAQREAGEQASRDLGALLDQPERTRAPGSTRMPHGSSAMAEAGNGRPSKTATAPTGSPGPRISRMMSRSGSRLDDLHSSEEEEVDEASPARPSSKIVAPCRRPGARRAASSAARSSAVRGARIGIASKGIGGRAGTPRIMTSAGATKRAPAASAQARVPPRSRRLGAHRAHEVEQVENEREDDGDPHVRADPVENGLERGRVLEQPQGHTEPAAARTWHTRAAATRVSCPRRPAGSGSSFRRSAASGNPTVKTWRAASAHHRFWAGSRVVRERITAASSRIDQRPEAAECAADGGRGGARRAHHRRTRAAPEKAVARRERPPPRERPERARRRAARSAAASESAGR